MDKDRQRRRELIELRAGAGFDQLELGASQVNALSHAGLACVADLLLLTDAELLRVDGLGATGLRAVRNAVDTFMRETRSTQGALSSALWTYGARHKSQPDYDAIYEDVQRRFPNILQRPGSAVRAHDDT